MLELHNSTVDDQIRTSLSSDRDQALVQMVTMDQPPRLASGFFDTADDSVSNFGAILSPQIELLKRYKILADGLVDAVAFQEPRNVGCLYDVSKRNRPETHQIATICIPAPISPNCEAASKTVTVHPACAMAMAAITPPIPAPMMPTSSCRRPSSIVDASCFFKPAEYNEPTEIDNDDRSYSELLEGLSNSFDTRNDLLLDL